MAEWYYKVLGDVVGPLSSREFLERVRSGEVTEEMHVRKDDALWVPARAVTGLFDYATEKSADTVCPYCGSKIDTPPTRCTRCRRRISVSYQAHAGSTQARVETAAEQMQVGETFDEGQPDSIIANIAVILMAIFMVLSFGYLIYLVFKTKHTLAEGGILGLLLLPVIISSFTFYLQWKYRKKKRR